MKKFLMTTSLILGSICVMAQERSELSKQRESVHSTYETNRFLDNWFIQLGAGPTVYLGGQNSNGFGSRLSSVFDLGIGKWLTPFVGIRMQLNYAPSMKEYSALYSSPFSQWGALSNGQRLQKFNFMNLHADFMWNISSTIGGYNETRFYEIIPYVGFGLGRNSYSGVRSNTELTANLGLINKFRVSKTVDINLELRSAIVNGRFDNSRIDNLVDVPVAATIGATFRIGKVKKFKRVATAAPTSVADYSSYQNRIKALENDNSNLNEAKKQLTDEVNALKNRKAETINNTDLKVAASPVALFFNLGESTLNSKELTNLAFFVKNAIKVDPNKVFTLIGSADKATGSAEVNQRISEQRVQYVYDLLVNKYNISADRLVKKAVGDVENRFAEPVLNRVVIVE